MKKERSDTKQQTTHRGRRSTAALQRRKQRRDALTTGTAQPSVAQGREEGAKCNSSQQPTSGSCKADLQPLVFEATEFTLVHCNLNCCTAKHMAELHGHLKLLDYPAFVALNETKLDSCTPDSEVKLENYTLVARRDRPEENKPKRRKKRLATGCGGGGVALYARTDCTTSVVLLEHSTTHERTWLTVHTLSLIHI